MENRNRLRWREAVRDPSTALALLASVRMTETALALLASVRMTILDASLRSVCANQTVENMNRRAAGRPGGAYDITILEPIRNHNAYNIVHRHSG